MTKPTHDSKLIARAVWDVEARSPGSCVGEPLKHVTREADHCLQRVEGSLVVVPHLPRMGIQRVDGSLVAMHGVGVEWEEDQRGQEKVKKGRAVLHLV